MSEQFARSREEMVEKQLRPRGILDERVLAAFREVPRHLFVPPELAGSAYEDCPLPIGCDQTISQPYMVALMTQELELRGGEKVLEIGTGSGYQTAILALLAGRVYSVERFPELVEKARGVLAGMATANVELRCGDGTQGWREHAPFDRIMVTAAAPEPPRPLLEQLEDPGKMVIPCGGSYAQDLTVIEKRKGRFRTRDVCGCVFVPLVGEFGWKVRDG